MNEWLRERISRLSGRIDFACLFGSYVNGNKNPNDIDMVLVASSGVGSEEWLFAIKESKLISAEFISEFSIPLSTMVLSPQEWLQVDGIVVRERDIIWISKNGF